MVLPISLGECTSTAGCRNTGDQDYTGIVAVGIAKVFAGETYPLKYRRAEKRSREWITTGSPLVDIVRITCCQRIVSGGDTCSIGTTFARGSLIGGIIEIESIQSVQGV